MKCQLLFSGKNNQNIINLSSTELAQRSPFSMKSQLLFSEKNNQNITNWLSAELAQRKVKVNHIIRTR